MKTYYYSGSTKSTHVAEAIVHHNFSGRIEAENAKEAIGKALSVAEILGGDLIGISAYEEEQCNGPVIAQPVNATASVTEEKGTEI